MGLDPETLQRICNMAIEAAGVALHPIVGDPRRLIVDQNGDRELLVLPAPLRAHTVADLGSLADAINRYGQKTGSVWHAERQVVFLVDDADRRERITLPLTFSQQFERLAGLAKAPVLKQAGIVRLLRHDLDGAVAKDLLPRFRSIEFKRRNDGQGTIEHGRESLGRSVEAAVQNAENLPDWISASVRVYSTAGLTRTVCVRMSLDIDAGREEFTLQPLPDELEMAVQLSQAEIVEFLRGECGDGLAIFAGTP